MKKLISVLSLVASMILVVSCGIDSNSDLAGWGDRWGGSSTKYVATSDDNLTSFKFGKHRDHETEFTSKKSFVDACSKCCTHILHDNQNADGFECRYVENGANKQCYKLDGVRNANYCF